MMTSKPDLRRVGRALVGAGGAVTAVLLTATPAGAHVGGPTHGFADGWLHPLLGPDHLLAMVAVGIVAAVSADATRARSGRAWSGAATFWAAPLAFIAGMAVGGAVGLAGITFPAIEVAIVISVIALGLAVAGAVGSAYAWTLPLLLLAGLAHGNAHGAEAPAAASPILYVAGFLVATVGLHLCGLAGGAFIRQRPWLRVGVGATVASAGVLLLV